MQSDKRSCVISCESARRRPVEHKRVRYHVCVGTIFSTGIFEKKFTFLRSTSESTETCRERPGKFSIHTCEYNADKLNPAEFQTNSFDPRRQANGV